MRRNNPKSQSVKLAFLLDCYESNPTSTYKLIIDNKHIRTAI